MILAGKLSGWAKIKLQIHRITSHISGGCCRSLNLGVIYYTEKANREIGLLNRNAAITKTLNMWHYLEEARKVVRILLKLLAKQHINWTCLLTPVRMAMYISGNLHISSKLSNLLVHKYP